MCVCVYTYMCVYTYIICCVCRCIVAVLASIIFDNCNIHPSVSILEFTFEEDIRKIEVHSDIIIGLFMSPIHPIDILRNGSC